MKELPGDLVMLYFLRTGYYPQIRPVTTPEGKRAERPRPWKKLPGNNYGVWAGVVCTYVAGGKHTSLFYFEECTKSQSVPLELDGELMEIEAESIRQPPGSIVFAGETQWWIESGFPGMGEGNDRPPGLPHQVQGHSAGVVAHRVGRQVFATPPQRRLPRLVARS